MTEKLFRKMTEKITGHSHFLIAAVIFLQILGNKIENKKVNEQQYSKQ